MNKKLNLILEESFLKELISKGVSIFDYRNNSLYYEAYNKKVKADILATEEEVINLAKKISFLFGKEFNELNPIVSISNSEVKLLTNHYDKNISFYLDITK